MYRVTRISRTGDGNVPFREQVIEQRKAVDRGHTRRDQVVVHERHLRPGECVDVTDSVRNHPTMDKLLRLKVVRVEKLPEVPTKKPMVVSVNPTATSTEET